MTFLFHTRLLKLVSWFLCYIQDIICAVFRILFPCNWFLTEIAWDEHPKLKLQLKSDIWIVKCRTSRLQYWAFSMCTGMCCTKKGFDAAPRKGGIKLLQEISSHFMHQFATQLRIMPIPLGLISGGPHNLFRKQYVQLVGFFRFSCIQKSVFCC